MNIEQFEKLEDASLLVITWHGKIDEEMINTINAGKALKKSFIVIRIGEGITTPLDPIFLDSHIVKEVSCHNIQNLQGVVQQAVNEVLNQNAYIPIILDKILQQLKKN